jgi:hypothetical protein
MPFIGRSPKPTEDSNFTTRRKDTFTSDSSTTQFTLSKAVGHANDIAVFVGNVRQEPNTAYTVNGTTLDFGSGNAPATGLDMYVVHQAGTLESSVVPADGTISTAKLADDSVTGAKIENNPTIAGKITATGGITFGSDTAATNVLDDYEEGTFNVGIKVNGAEQPTEVCKYVKIGAVVHVFMQATSQNYPYFSDPTSGAAGQSVTVNTTAGTGQLPFTPKHSDQGMISFSRGVRQSDGTAYAGENFAWGWVQGSTQLYLGANHPGSKYSVYDGNVDSTTTITLEKDNTRSNVVLASTFTYLTDD